VGQHVGGCSQREALCDLGVVVLPRRAQVSQDLEGKQMVRGVLPLTEPVVLDVDADLGADVRLTLRKAIPRES
jgi:hypothetical protein